MTVGGITDGCDLPVSGVRFQGIRDQQLKQLMKELGEAINESLSIPNRSRKSYRASRKAVTTSSRSRSNIGVSNRAKHDRQHSLVSAARSAPCDSK